jgi:hypothetical protein
VPELTARYAKESAKGLVIIGVTDEELSIVDPWIKKAKPGYPIVAVKGGEFDAALKVDAFPCQAVIDTDGKLVYSDGFGRTGSPDGALSAAMAKATKGSVWPKKFATTSELIGSGALDKSYAEFKKQLAGAADFSADEKAAATKLQTYLEAAAVEAQTEAKTLFDGGRIYDAHKRLEMFAKATPAFPATPDCAKLTAEIEAVPEYKNEMKAGEQFLAAQDLERAQSYSDAFKAYKAIVKTLATTKMAAIAKDKAEDLNKRGMLGYVPACEKCMAAKKACEKHAEKGKL